MENVREIRFYYNKYGGTYKGISKIFNLNITTVGNILRNETWKEYNDII